MVNLEDIIVRLTPFNVYGENLIRTSGGFKMLCPFHTEKRASFFIRGQTLTFHCFGCGKMGSAFDFIMKKENVEFADALKILAYKVGIDTSQLINSNKYTRLFELNKTALQFYKETLMKNEAAMTYLLRERGLTQESIERFHLGYADNVSVVPFLRGKDFSDEEIIESGMGKAKNGGIKDHFRERIIFPIIQRGKVIGFGGRIIGKGEPKYLNSSASPIFHKKEILYGLDAVAIREAGYAFMVEGYVDVIMCHQLGYKNTVSTLGTAVGIEHIRLIRKYANTLYTLFDGDAAGMRALEMTARICFEKKIKGGVIMLPEE